MNQCHNLMLAFSSLHQLGITELLLWILCCTVMCDKACDTPLPPCDNM